VKVLHVYSGNLFGGIETLLLTIARGQNLVPQMIHSFALCFEGRLSNELKQSGAEVFQLGNVKLSRPWTVLKARVKLKQILRKSGFDVVICHGCWPEAIFGSVAKSNNIPLVFWCHDTPQAKHLVEKLAKLTPPDLTIANSFYTQSSIDLLYPKTPSEVLYCPVTANVPQDTQAVRNTIRNNLNTPENAVVIIQSSRLERWKGQGFLLEALGQLRDLPNWICWIAGGVQKIQENEYFQELKNQAQELGIGDRVLFLGQRSDVANLLVAADIHCQPNTGPEPFGIALIEALYSGLPVVTTNIGAALEISDESCGRLVQSGNLESLSNTLSELIVDPSIRLKLASFGRAKATNMCDPQRQLSSLYELLANLVSSYLRLRS